MKNLVKEEYEKNKKLREEEKKKLSKVYKKLQKQNKKLRQEKQRIKSKKRKIKTFDEYFHEYIKNKTIPKDTLPYLKKALERAMKEYNKGLIHEKSAL